MTIGASCSSVVAAASGGQKISQMSAATSLVDNLQTTLIAGTALYLIPLLMQRVKASVSASPDSSRLFKVIWLSAFVLNLITVSLPGRFDSEANREKSESEKKTGTILTFTPVFAPSGWAFAIWGVIYLGELLLTGFIALFGSAPQFMSVLKDATPYWVGANAFQSLWCAAFRPKFRKRLWLPSLCLVMAAYSQLRCLYTIMNSSYADFLLEFFFISSNSFAKFLIAFPIALHGGWLCAAALLNLNSWVTESGASMGKNIAMAFFSTYFAAGLSMYATLRTHNPFVMGTIAWALAAVADNIKNNKTAQAAKLNADTRESLDYTIKGVSNGLLILSLFVPNLVWIRRRTDDLIF